jgi:hypothetical protein
MDAAPPDRVIQRSTVMVLQQGQPSLQVMRSPFRATAELFQQEVAKLLGLPPGSGDAEVRHELLNQGPDCIAWYDTRLQAIAESNTRSTAPGSNPPVASLSHSIAPNS